MFCASDSCTRGDIWSSISEGMFAMVGEKVRFGNYLRSISRLLIGCRSARVFVREKLTFCCSFLVIQSVR